MKKVKYKFPLEFSLKAVFWSMFTGHFLIILSIFLFRYLGGLDEEETDYSLFLFLPLLLAYLWFVAKVYFSERYFRKDFSGRLIWFIWICFSLILLCVSVKSLAPNVMNFKDMSIFILIIEFFLNSLTWAVILPIKKL